MSSESLLRAGDRLGKASETVENAVLSDQLATLGEQCENFAHRDPDPQQLASLETTLRSASRRLDGDAAITVRRAGQDIVVYRDQHE